LALLPVDVRKGDRSNIRKQKKKRSVEMEGEDK
jgi:hypothetical protein